MSELLELVAIFTAIAVGWLLGRYDRNLKDLFRSEEERSKQLQSSLEVIFDEQKHGHAGQFIEKLDLDSSNLDFHMAVGRFFRSRGELEKAIEVHQNLFARPEINKFQSARVQVELARDYLAAGLLGRAETLLSEVVDKHKGHGDDKIRTEALLLLLCISEEEKDWEKSIKTANQLLLKGDDAIQQRLAHYCCEMAEQTMESSEFALARRHLKQAFSYDRNCVRASLLMGQVELLTGDPQSAIKALKRVFQQDMSFSSETLEFLEKAYQSLNNKQGYHDTLLALYQARPISPVVQELFVLKVELEGESSASQLLVEHLEKMPSLHIAYSLFEQSIKDYSDERLPMVAQVFQQKLKSQSKYQCQSCGFTGNQLEWRCSSCKHWGTVKPTDGLPVV